MLAGALDVSVMELVKPLLAAASTEGQTIGVVATPRG
jgi:hypothetical protein